MAIARTVHIAAISAMNKIQTVVTTSRFRLNMAYTMKQRECGHYLRFENELTTDDEDELNSNCEYLAYREAIGD